PARAGTAIAFSGCDRQGSNVREKGQAVPTPSTKACSWSPIVPKAPDAAGPRALQAVKASVRSPISIVPRRSTLNRTSSQRASAAKTRPGSRHETGGSQGEPALRRLYPCLDRTWPGAGIQLARQSARGGGGLYQEPGPRGLETDPGPLS